MMIPSLLRLHQLGSRRASAVVLWLLRKTILKAKTVLDTEGPVVMGHETSHDDTCNRPARPAHDHSLPVNTFSLRSAVVAHQPNFFLLSCSHLSRQHKAVIVSSNIYELSLCEEHSAGVACIAKVQGTTCAELYVCVVYVKCIRIACV